MIYPTINDLSKDEYNRYEIALATAKCARMITNEYVRQRKEAERAGAGTKDGDKPLTNMIDRELYRRGTYQGMRYKVIGNSEE